MRPYPNKKYSIKSLLKNLLSTLGYQVNKKGWNVPKEPANYIERYQVDGLEFERINPFGTYAPWLEDKDFLNTYGQIVEHTLVDRYRCFELWQMTENINRLDKSASFIEIGVWRGGTAAIIAEKLGRLSSSVPFYIADTFRGVVKASEKDASYNGGEHADTTLEIVKSLLRNRYDNLHILNGIFPEETGGDIILTERFGFCHIDVDVYDSAKDIVDWIWDRLIIGGIIVFDDYGFSSCTGIIKYVNDQRGKNDRLILYNLNGHAIMIKIQ